MKNLILLLLFWGISAFVKNLMKRKRAPQSVETSKNVPEKGWFDKIGQLLNVEIPQEAIVAPRHDKPVQPAPTLLKKEHVVVPPAPSQATKTRKKPRARHKRTCYHATLRQGILMQEILRPCRALQPLKKHT